MWQNNLLSIAFLCMNIQNKHVRGNDILNGNENVNEERASKIILHLINFRNLS